MGLHLGRRDRPSIERALGEGHDLGTPDVRKPTVRPGDHGRVGGSKRLDPGQLPGVTERKIGAVGSLLRKHSTWDRDRLATDALEVSRRPRPLGRGREPTECGAKLRLERPTHIDHDDLLGGIGRQRQGSARRPGTRSDDQRCRHCWSCSFWRRGDPSRTEARWLIRGTRDQQGPAVHPAETSVDVSGIGNDRAGPASFPTEGPWVTPWVAEEAEVPPPGHPIR